MILFYTKEQIADFQKQIFITLLLGNYYLQSLEYETEKKALFGDILWYIIFCMNCVTNLASECAPEPPKSWPTPTGF